MFNEQTIQYTINDLTVVSKRLTECAKRLKVLGPFLADDVVLEYVDDATTVLGTIRQTIATGAA